MAANVRTIKIEVIDYWLHVEDIQSIISSSTKLIVLAYTICSRLRSSNGLHVTTYEHEWNIKGEADRYIVLYHCLIVSRYSNVMELFSIPSVANIITLKISLWVELNGLNNDQADWWLEMNPIDFWRVKSTGDLVFFANQYLIRTQIEQIRFSWEKVCQSCCYKIADTWLKW